MRKEITRRKLFKYGLGLGGIISASAMLGACQANARPLCPPEAATSQTEMQEKAEHVIQYWVNKLGCEPPELLTDAAERSKNDPSSLSSAILRVFSTPENNRLIGNQSNELQIATPTFGNDPNPIHTLFDRPIKDILHATNGELPEGFRSLPEENDLISSRYHPHSLRVIFDSSGGVAGVVFSRYIGYETINIDNDYIQMYQGHVENTRRTFLVYVPYSALVEAAMHSNLDEIDCQDPLLQTVTSGNGQSINSTWNQWAQMVLQSEDTQVIPYVRTPSIRIFWGT